MLKCFQVFSSQVSQTTVCVLVELGIIDFQITISPIKSAHFLPFHFLLVLQSFCWLSTAIVDRCILNFEVQSKGSIKMYNIVIDLSNYKVLINKTLDLLKCLVMSFQLTRQLH